MKASENPFPKVRYIGQASAPATPPVGEAYLYVGTDEELYIIRSDGVPQLLSEVAGTGGGGGAPGHITITEHPTAPTARNFHVEPGWMIAYELVSGNLRKKLLEIPESNPGFTLAAPPTTNPRIDIITVDNGGSIGAVTGTQAASPVPPTITNAYQTPIYLVHQRVGSTAIRDEDNGVDSYLEDIQGVHQINPFIVDSSGSVALANAITQIKDHQQKTLLQLSPGAVVLNASGGNAGASIFMYATVAGKHYLQNGHGVVFPSAASDPASGDSQEGQVYFNTTTDKLRVYDGLAWVDLH